MTRSLRCLFVAASVGLAMLSAPPADACFNVTQAEVDAQTKKVKAAQDALDAEDHAGAHRQASQAISFLWNALHAVHEDGKMRSPQNTPVDPPDRNLLRRAYRIDTLALSRAPKSTAAVREEQVKTFEQQVLVPDADPSLLADYAELLSRVPARTGQATMMLRALRDKDLIGSAHAWLALAKIEKQAGNADAEKAARERCQNAATKKAICTG